MKNDGNKIQEERWGYATSLQVAEEQIITQWKLPPKAILEQCIDGEILHATYLFPDIILDIVFEIPPVLQDHASKNCSNRFQYLGAPTMSSSARSNLDATWWLQTGRFWAVNFSNIYTVGMEPYTDFLNPGRTCFLLLHGAEIWSSSKECWKYQPTLLKATTLP